MRILIVEDEPVVAKRLERLLSQGGDAKARRIEHARSLDEALKVLKQNRYDVLLLDLNLDGKDGFDLLGAAVAGAHQTIVVSANTDRALEAFEYGVVDFVPKPFDAKRLEKALQRIGFGGDEERHRARVLSFREGSKLRIVEVQRVRGIHGAGQYSEVELDDGQRLLHDKTLEQLEHLLPTDFMRVHRSHILDLKRITALESQPGSRYFARMDDGELIPVSRQRITELRAHFD